MLKLLTGLFLILPCYLQAQEVNRYMVFFKDKEHNQFSLEQPLEFLSPAAVERRERQQIPLSPEDLPVSPLYINKVEAAGPEVFYSSRWFNAVLAEAREDQAAKLMEIPEVLEVLLVAPGPKLNNAKQNTTGQRISFRQKKAILPENFQNTILGVPQMQEKGFSGQGKIIAVLDGGFTAVDQLPYFSHLFTEGKLLAQHDFTTSSSDVFRYSTHGTKALSTISAIDSAAFIGTAPGAGLLLAVTEDVKSEYVIEEYNWLFAAEWADSAGADVISASLGYNTFDDPSMNYSYAQLDGITTVSARAAGMAAERGIVVVVSAGNSGNDAWKYIVTPADAPGIIAVGAIQENNEIARFSSRGPSADKRIKPEVVALGHRTIVADVSGGFTTGNGTSFAAPQIAGFVASVWSAYPDLSSKELRKQILESGNRSSMPDSVYGWGVPFFPGINAALLYLDSQKPDKGVKIYPNPVQEGHVYLEFKEEKEGDVKVNLFSATGLQLINQQKLKETGGNGRTYGLDINHLPKGVFFIQIIHNGSAFTQKILKF